MPLVAAKCTQCGAELQVDNSKDAAVCQFCNTPFIVEKAINNYNTYVTQNFAGANVTIVGQDFESIKTRATMFLEERNFAKALEYADKALDIKPDDAEIYCIKLLAKNNVTNLGQLQNLGRRLRNDTDFQRVLQFGNDDITSELNAVADHIDKILDKKQYIENLHKEKEKLVHQLNVLETKYIADDKNKKGGKFLKVFGTISAIVIILGGLLLCIAVPPVGLLFIAFGVAIYIICKKYYQKTQIPQDEILQEMKSVKNRILEINHQISQ